jgi:hypothetical protein
MRLLPTTSSLTAPAMTSAYALPGRAANAPIALRGAGFALAERCMR